MGDDQNLVNMTDSDGRSQVGQLWYQQTMFGDQLRLKGGKLDGNDDFDVLDNGQEFLNNSFTTSPTLGLLPSFPDTGVGIELFYGTSQRVLRRGRDLRWIAGTRTGDRIVRSQLFPAARRQSVSHRRDGRALQADGRWP